VSRRSRVPLATLRQALVSLAQRSDVGIVAAGFFVLAFAGFVMLAERLAHTPATFSPGLRMVARMALDRASQSGY
jgi:hypothetical protein